MALKRYVIVDKHNSSSSSIVEDMSFYGELVESNTSMVSIYLIYSLRTSRNEPVVFLI